MQCAKPRHPAKKIIIAIPALTCLALALTFAAKLSAQTPPAATKPAPDEKVAADAKFAAEHKAERDLMELPQAVQTFYLPNSATQMELNDTQTAMRNMVGPAKLYALPNDNKIIVGGTPAELAVAQKVFEAIDFSKKLYRLTYTVTDSENGKRIGEQHFSLVVASGGKTSLKQGSKVPVITGSTAPETTTQHTDVVYLDVGLEIEANVDGYPDSLRLRSKVSQSGVIEDKSSVATSQGDPIIRQTTLEGAAILTPGKPLALGSLDTPGSTRHQEIEVVYEVIK